MSSRGLSVPCECGEDCLHLIKSGDDEESEDCETFAWGYSCWVCGARWKARDSDRLDHPTEYIDYHTVQLMQKRHWKQVKEIEKLKEEINGLKSSCKKKLE